MASDIYDVQKRPVNAGPPEVMDWGFVFRVKSELDAYKIAYAYRYNKGTVLIEYTPHNELAYNITMFNEDWKH